MGESDSFAHGHQRQHYAGSGPREVLHRDQRVSLREWSNQGVEVLEDVFLNGQYVLRGFGVVVGPGYPCTGKA